MFQRIYNNVCNNGKFRKWLYAKGSGLHEHHIKPTHMGGDNAEENFTYLTVREHILCHYLLWKLHKNPNDLRSMHMLGARLTPAMRKITGIFCRDNKIGFHSFTSEQRKESSKKGGIIARNNKKGFHGLSKEKQRNNAANAGTASWNANQFKKIGLFGRSQEKISNDAKKGAAIIAAKFKGTIAYVNMNTNKLVRTNDILSSPWIPLSKCKAICNGIEVRYVSVDLLNGYLKTGWIMGRFKTWKKAMSLES